MLSAASALAEHQSAAVGRIDELLGKYGGAILADEPGLGKSYVAAEIARRERHAEVIVPASLVGQWEETLLRFGASARVTTHDRIVNEPFVPPPHRRLVIVDEAHAFRNPATQRYDALARRSVGARLLLVTATPLCNSAGDLASLIRLIVADDALLNVGVPSIDLAFHTRDREAILAVISELVIRRDRYVLPPDLQFGELERRIIRYDSGAREIQPLIEALRFPLVGESAILRQFLLRRLESSDAALRESLRRQRRFYERALECLAAGRALPKREYRRVFSREEDADAFQRVLFWELFVPSDATANAEELQAELERIDTIASHRFSSRKREALIELCRKANEPLLIFTGWAATATDLFDAAKHIRRAALVTGRNRSSAAEAIDDFCSGRVDVLVSTDLAAEGLNLQRAGVVVHYDIPWNPVKLEQRNGRAHRIGQRRDQVKAVYFVPQNDDTGILLTMSRKNRIRRGLLVGAACSRPRTAAGRPYSGLRPRVQADAAIVKFIQAVETRGGHVPECLIRRHREGLERLLAALSRESIDDCKLRDLGDLLAIEGYTL